MKFCLHFNFIIKRGLTLQNPQVFEQQLRDKVIPVMFESLLSTHGDESGMLEDMQFVIRHISNIRLQVMFVIRHISNIRLQVMFVIRHISNLHVLVMRGVLCGLLCYMLSFLSKISSFSAHRGLTINC